MAATNAQVWLALRWMGYADDVIGTGPPGEGRDVDWSIEGVNQSDITTAGAIASQLNTKDGIKGNNAIIDLLTSRLSKGQRLSDQTKTELNNYWDKRPPPDQLSGYLANPTGYVVTQAPPPGAPAPPPGDLPAGSSTAIPGGAPAPPPAAPAAKPVTPGPVITPSPRGTAAGATGGVGKPAVTDTSQLPKPMDPAAAEAFIRQHYGYMASLLDIPDIHKILYGVADGSIAPGEFDHQLMATDWAKTRNDAQQAWEILKATKPAQADAQLTASSDEIKGFAVGLGFTLDDNTAKDIATSALSMGWDPTQTRNAVASHYSYISGQSANAGVAKQLGAKAADYLVPMSDQDLTKWGQQVIAGTSTMDDFESYARNIAKGQYPGLAQWLDQDPTRTVKQYITPYANQAADILEMPADQVDFTKPKFAAFFGKLDPKTGEREVMSGPEWSTYLKQQTEWQYTKNAHDTVSNLTDTLAKTFGQVG